MSNKFKLDVFHNSDGYVERQKLKIWLYNHIKNGKVSLFQDIVHPNSIYVFL